MRILSFEIARAHIETCAAHIEVRTGDIKKVHFFDKTSSFMVIWLSQLLY